MNPCNLGSEFRLPLGIGVSAGGEDADIISAEGWFVATVELSPSKEIAEHICRCVNMHDELVEALEATNALLCRHQNSDENENFDPFIAKNNELLLRLGVQP